MQQDKTIDAIQYTNLADLIKSMLNSLEYPLFTIDELNAMRIQHLSDVDCKKLEIILTLIGYRLPSVYQQS